MNWFVVLINFLSPCDDEFHAPYINTVGFTFFCRLEELVGKIVNEILNENGELKMSIFYPTGLLDTEKKRQTTMANYWVQKIIEFPFDLKWLFEISHGYEKIKKLDEMKLMTSEQKELGERLNNLTSYIERHHCLPVDFKVEIHQLDSDGNKTFLSQESKSVINICQIAMITEGFRIIEEIKEGK